MDLRLRSGLGNPGGYERTHTVLMVGSDRGVHLCVWRMVPGFLERLHLRSVHGLMAGRKAFCVLGCYVVVNSLFQTFSVELLCNVTRIYLLIT